MLKLPGEHVARLRQHYQGRRVCVTGGAGFIGGHLIDALLSVGATIAAIDDLSNSTAEHLGELIDIEPERVRFVHGSILDDEAVADATVGAELVFHLAAIGSVPRSLGEPQRCWSVNATGTVRVLEAARRAGVRRFINSSSSSVYGDQQTLPKLETQPCEPLSPYAASKVAAEAAARAWAASFALPTISLRYFNVFGPRQPADSPYSAVIAAFARRLMSGESPVIYGDGLHSRDFTFVSNVVLANLLAGASQRDPAGEAVNIGTGRRTDLLELARRMAELCGAAQLQPVHEPPRPGDPRHSQADISLAHRLLGYIPIASLEIGLEQTIAWYRAALAEAEGSP